MVSEKEEEPEPEKVQEKKVDETEAKLAGLKEEEPEPEPVEEKVEEKKEDLSKENEKLKNLLGDD